MIFESDLTDNIIKLLKEDIIANQNIFGILQNCNNYKIYVDDKILPTGVVVNNGYHNYIYTKNDSFVDEIIGYLGSRKGEYGFSGINSKVAKKIKSKFEIEWENPCTLYYYPCKNIDTSKIKTKVSSVRLEDSEVVDSYYTYRDEESIYSIKEAIRNRASRCVYKDGDPVSWLLIHKDNSLGPMFTKEAYRKEGYAIDVTLSLVEELLKDDKIPYLHVVKGNFASNKLAEKCGFKEYGECEWFGIIV